HGARRGAQRDLPLRVALRHGPRGDHALVPRGAREAHGGVARRPCEDARRMSSFAALKHRNFRLMWGALMVSFTGSELQNAVVLWQVSLLAPEGHRGVALGGVGLARFLPL